MCRGVRGRVVGCGADSAGLGSGLAEVAGADFVWVVWGVFGGAGARGDGVVGEEGGVGDGGGGGVGGGREEDRAGAEEAVYWR